MLENKIKRKKEEKVDRKKRKDEMIDSEYEKEKEFLVEKIKDRPINKKKLLRRTMITASMAVMFGLISCFTFLILEPLINNWLYPENASYRVTFPEDSEEMSPEEMLSDNMQEGNKANRDSMLKESLGEDNLEDIISDTLIDKNGYDQIYMKMANYANELGNYMVTVTGVTSQMDWFNNVEISKHQSYGAVVADNGKDFLVLVDYTALEKAERLSLMFASGIRVDAKLEAIDSTTNLALLSVGHDVLEKETYINNLRIAPLGSSNSRRMVGTPIIALGSPMGIGNSFVHGVVTAVGSCQLYADTNYEFLQTNIVGSRNGTGFLFNMSGEIIGVITNDRVNEEMQDMLTAYGITDLKKRIEKMSNGETMPYMGIKGVDVTKEANEELNVPYGAYITGVDMESPSMLAGIQQGDVLVSLDGKPIFNYDDYIVHLGQLESGKNVEVKVMRLRQDEYKEMEFHLDLQ